MIKVGTPCIVIRATAHPELLGALCTCIANKTGHAFGSHIFKMLDGSEFWGDPFNVKPIAPPPTVVSTVQRRRVTA